MPNLEKVFHLLYPTENQLVNSKHVRIHIDLPQGKFEEFLTKHRSQFNPLLQFPTAVRGILEDSTKPYTSGWRDLAEYCIHYHTIEVEANDFWDFYFPHPDYDESVTPGCGYITTPGGNMYTQQQIGTIYRRETMCTTHSKGNLYNAQETDCREYREVYNKDFFKHHHPRNWQSEYNKFERAQEAEVRKAKNTWKCRYPQLQKWENQEEQEEKETWIAKIDDIHDRYKTWLSTQCDKADNSPEHTRTDSQSNKSSSDTES